MDKLLPTIPDDLKGGIEIRLESWPFMQEYLYSNWKEETEKRGFKVDYIEADGQQEPFRCVRISKK